MFVIFWSHVIPPPVKQKNAKMIYKEMYTPGNVTLFTYANEEGDTPYSLRTA